MTLMSAGPPRWLQFGNIKAGGILPSVGQPPLGRSIGRAIDYFAAITAGVIAACAAPFITAAKKLVSSYDTSILGIPGYRFALAIAGAGPVNSGPRTTRTKYFRQPLVLTEPTATAKAAAHGNDSANANTNTDASNADADMPRPVRIMFAASTYGALERIATRRDRGLPAAVRQCVSLTDFLETAIERGARVLIDDGGGTQRELVIR